MHTNTGSRLPFWFWPVAFCFAFYFGVLIYSEAFLPGKSIDYLERKRYIQGGLLITAFLLMRAHPADVRARLGALLLAATGTAPLFPSAEMRQVWATLPPPFNWFLWVPQITHILVLPIFFSFHAMLPRPVFTRPSSWLLVWAPVLPGALWAMNELHARIKNPSITGDVPKWVLFTLGLAILVYGFGALMALLVNATRVVAPEERSRMNLLLAGLCLGWSPGLLFLTAIFWGPLTSSKLVWWLVVPPWRTFALFMWILVPISLLHAVFWNRIFELPLQERRASFRASYLTKL